MVLNKASLFSPIFPFSLLSFLVTIMTYTVYYGTLIHSVSLTELEIIKNGVLVVENEKGVIVHVEKEVSDLDSFLATTSFQDAKVRFNKNKSKKKYYCNNWFRFKN